MKETKFINLDLLKKSNLALYEFIICDATIYEKTTVFKNGKYFTAWNDEEYHLSNNKQKAVEIILKGYQDLLDEVLEEEKSEL